MSTVIQLRGDAWRRIESGTWLVKFYVPCSVRGSAKPTLPHVRPLWERGPARGRPEGSRCISLIAMEPP